MKGRPILNVTERTGCPALGGKRRGGATAVAATELQLHQAAVEHQLSQGLQVHLGHVACPLPACFLICKMGTITISSVLWAVLKMLQW